MRPRWYRWYGILLAAELAGCTSPASGKSQVVPDHFNDNLDVLMRAIAHPCGADVDTDGDGKVDLHYTYTYDPLGRSQRDLALDLTGALYEQIDYTWDNAGHLIRMHDVMQDQFLTDQTLVYDTLGRQTKYRDEEGTLDTVEASTTIDYSSFDELGHSAHGDERYENLINGTSETMSRAYGYDDLGRRISLEVHFDSGELFQSWQHTYDDAVHTVSTYLNQPLTLRRTPGNTYVELDTYDADAHLLSVHSASTAITGEPGLTVDSVTRWDGDRELSTLQSITRGGAVTSTALATFKYQCDSARVVTDHLPISTLPRPARPAFLRRPRIE